MTGELESVPMHTRYPRAPKCLSRGPHPFSGKVLYNATVCADPTTFVGADSANVYVVCILVDRVYTLQPL